QQAVLFRTSHHCGPLEVELTRRNIRFIKYGGLKFLDTAHIRDVLALLRFVENPRDGIAGFRLMQLIPGIGPGSARSVLAHMLEAPDPIRALFDLPLPTRAADDWGTFVETVASLHSGRSGWPAELEEQPAWHNLILGRPSESLVQDHLNFVWVTTIRVK